MADIDEWIIDIKDMDRHVYEEYTGVSIGNLIENLFRIKDIVDKSKLRIRVPRIPEYNDDEKIEESVKWIRDVMGVEPEVFEYFRTPDIKPYNWMDDYEEKEE